MFEDVGQRLADHGFGVSQQAGAHDHIDGTDEPEGGREAEERTEFLDQVDGDLPHETGLDVLAQIEDRRADLFDRVVDVIDRAGESCPGLAVRHRGRRCLQAESRGEQALDDVIVQVASDPVPIFQHGEALLVGPPVEEFERDRRLVGKGFRQLQIRGPE